MIDINTEKPTQVMDITPMVEEAIKESGIEEGICLVYTNHTTTSIVINEAESGLIQDLLSRMASLAPPSEGYLHNRIDDNAHAHLQAALLGNSQVIPVRDGSLVLGTWQKVLFVELDGPRHRKVSVTVMAISSG